MNGTDNALLKGLIDGDKKQIYELYQKLFPKVRQFILRNNGNQEDAEDIFQKALLQFITRVKLRGTPEIKSIEAYLFTINKNLWRRELNKTERVTNVQVNEHDSESNVNHGEIGDANAKRLFEDEAISLLEQERWELYKNCFKKLSENCQQILEFFFKRKSYSDFCKEFDYNSESVARQRVFKCKAKLVQLIKTHVDFKRLKNL